MKFAYFDCFCGISGDMILGALVNVGVNIDFVRSELKSLDVKGYEITSSETKRGHITGTKVDVLVNADVQQDRNFKTIRHCIENSSLDNKVKTKSIEIFTKIARAEAKIHGTTVEDVHFHEVGAVDSIVDIVGAVIAIESLFLDKIVSSPINTGGGMVQTRHGNYPIPAPATCELLSGIPCYDSGIKAELTTPTGAAIVAAYASTFSDLPLCTLEKTGYGAGTKKFDHTPNMLRVHIGHDLLKPEPDSEDVVMLETNIDDMNPEFYDYIIEKGLIKGALDIFITPVIMKKSRPAATLSVLVSGDTVDDFIRFLFYETTSFGIRVSKMARRKINRERSLIPTQFGDITVTSAKLDGTIVTVSPEYEECKKIALETGIPIKEIFDEVKTVSKVNPYGECSTPE